MAKKAQKQAEVKTEQMNIMRTPKIEKVVLSVGGTADKLEKGVKLIERLSGKKAVKRKSSKRIPSLNVRPGLEVGALVTMRGEETKTMIKRILVALNNVLKRKQISENSFTMGVKEYIEIPGIAYQRDVGVMGLDITVTFTRAGRRVKLKKIKRGVVSKKQNVSKEEIIKFMEDNFQVKFK